MWPLGPLSNKKKKLVSVWQYFMKNLLKWLYIESNLFPCVCILIANKMTYITNSHWSHKHCMKNGAKKDLCIHHCVIDLKSWTEFNFFWPRIYWVSSEKRSNWLMPRMGTGRGLILEAVVNDILSTIAEAGQKLIPLRANIDTEHNTAPRVKTARNVLSDRFYR
jgi:hypothetical protein